MVGCLHPGIAVIAGRIRPGGMPLDLPKCRMEVAAKTVHVETGGIFPVELFEELGRVDCS